MHAAEDGVLEQVDDEGLGGLLERGQRVRGEAEVMLVLQGDLANEAGEGEQRDEVLDAQLKLSDLPQRLVAAFLLPRGTLLRDGVGATLPLRSGGGGGFLRYGV